MQKINDKVNFMILDQKSSGSRPDRTTDNEAKASVIQYITEAFAF
jgi:hypothetical protein